MVNDISADVSSDIIADVVGAVGCADTRDVTGNIFVKQVVITFNYLTKLGGYEARLLIL